MRRILPLLLLPALAGCFFLPSGESSRVEKVPDDLLRPRVAAPRVADRHAFGDVTKLQPGQWASYREGERTFTLAVVGKAGDSVWIEVIEEGEPRQVSARLVGPDGVVHKASYGEISKDGTKSAVVPQVLGQNGGAALLRLGEGGRDSGEETVVVGGRELKARRISVRSEDLEGRLTEETTLWHPDVPGVYAGSAAGGLVRRKTAASTLELAAFGADARPLLDLPR